MASVGERGVDVGVEGAGCGLCTGCFDGRYPIDPETGEMLEG